MVCPTTSNNVASKSVWQLKIVIGARTAKKERKHQKKSINSILCFAFFVYALYFLLALLKYIIITCFVHRTVTIVELEVELIILCLYLLVIHRPSYYCYP